MPTARFSIMSIRPIPYAPASRFTRAISSASASSSASTVIGMPCLNPMTIWSGGGAAAGSEVNAYGSSGGAFQGSSSTPASIARPKRFSSIENGDAAVWTTGMPCASAYSISSSRVQLLSRSGAMTFASGYVALNDSSNRSWSLPLPVHPWTTASAPRSTAISATACAITGRESADTSGYLPSYSAFVAIARAHCSSANSSLRSTSSTSLAPAAAPRVIDSSRSNSWPTSTSTAITSSKPYQSSLSQATMQLVSSPPEYATTAVLMEYADTSMICA